MLRSTDYPTASIGTLPYEVIFLESMTTEDYEKEREKLKRILSSMGKFLKNHKYYQDHEAGVYKPRTTSWYSPISVVSSVYGYELKTDEFDHILDKTKTLVARIARCYFENTNDYDEKVNFIRDIREIGECLDTACKGIREITFSSYNIRLMTFPQDKDIIKFRSLQKVISSYDKYHSTFEQLTASLEARKEKFKEEKEEKLKKEWEDDFRSSMVEESIASIEASSESEGKDIPEEIEIESESVESEESKDNIDFKKIPDPITGFSENDLLNVVRYIENNKESFEKSLKDKYEENGLVKMGDLFYDYNKKMSDTDPRLLTIRFFSRDEYILKIKTPRLEPRRSRSISMERIEAPGRLDKKKRKGEFKTNPEPCVFIRIHRAEIDGEIREIEKMVAVEQVSDLRKKVSGVLQISDRELRVARNEVNNLRELKGTTGVVDLYKAVWIPDIEGTYFKMAMYAERYSEGDLADVIERHRNQEVSDIVLDVLTKKEITEQLIRAMANIHSKKIIHMDIKTKNIIVSVKNIIKDGTVEKVIKVGICDLGFGQKWPVETIAGSPLYWAPEVINAFDYNKASMEKINTCSDVWSLYNVIYELWMERMPPWMVLTMNMDKEKQVRNCFKLLIGSIDANLDDWNAKKGKTPFEKFMLTGFNIDPEKRVKSEKMLEVWKRLADDIVEQFQETG